MTARHKTIAWIGGLVLVVIVVGVGVLSLAIRPKFVVKAIFGDPIEKKTTAARAHFKLGYELEERGKRDEAIGEYRKAIELKPDFAEALENLAGALHSQANEAEAIIAFKKARDAVRDDKARVKMIDSWIAEAEKSAGLVARLSALAQGTERPKDATEAFEIATICRRLKRYALSARFVEQAFRDDPKLADNSLAGHRYNAACSTALAASGQGIDDEKPNEQEKIRLRKQTLEWLKADLKMWSAQLKNSDRKTFVSQILRHWKNDPDLAALRVESSLKSLPEDEQTAWRAFWKDVDDAIESTGR